MLDLLLADARTPTGGFAQSGGIEPAALPIAMIPDLVRGRLATVGLVDAAVAAAAARGVDPVELEAAWAARTPAPPLREAATRQGRALLRLASLAWPGVLDGYRMRSAYTPRPVVLGLLGAHAGLEAARVACVCLYDDAATCVASVPKLYAVDSAVVTAWLVELAPLVEALAEQASRATTLPSPAAPLLDVRALAHAADPRRLFVT
jgi:urease accessory protein